MKTMHRFPVLLLALVAVMLTVGVAGAKEPWEKIKIPELNPVAMPEYERVELPNGMVLYLAEDRFVPMIELSAQLMVGSIYDPADKVGLASMTGSVLRTGGAGDRDGDAIDALVENRGMMVETWVGQSTGGAYLSCLVEDTDLGLELLADILTRPRFAENKIELAKQEQKASISRRNDEPLQIAMREAPKVLYGADHPLARHPEYDTVAAVTRQDMQAFHAEYFHPDRAWLVVIGDFDTADMKQRIEKAFAHWPSSGMAPPADPEVPMVPRTVNVAVKEGLTQATVLLGHKGIRNDNQDYAAIRVGAEILGGGFNSRLFKEIRSNQGLAYSVGATPGTGWRFPGSFLAYTMTKNESVEGSARAILAEIERMLAEPVSDEELQFAKDMILNSEVFSYDTKREVLDRLVMFEMYGYDTTFLQDYQEQVKNLTPAQIHEAVQRHWHPDQLTILVVGTPSEFDGDLSVFGPVNEIDIAIPAPKPQLVIPAATPESLAAGKELMVALRDRTGGAAYGKVKGYHEVSELNANIQGMALTFTIDRTVVMPDRMRVEQKTPFGNMTQVIDGDTGWASGPMGTEDVTGDDLDTMKKEMRSDTFAIMQELDGVECQALAPMEFAGVDCLPVNVTAAGKSQVYFLDAGTGLIRAIQSQDTNPVTRGPATRTVTVDEYQDMGDFHMPRLMRIAYDDEEFGTIEVKSFEANPKVDPAIFQK